MVDVEGGNNMMYLPLDKLMEHQGSSSTSKGNRNFSQAEIEELTRRVIEQASRNSANNPRRGATR